MGKCLGRHGLARKGPGQRGDSKYSKNLDQHGALELSAVMKIYICTIKYSSC